MTDAAPRKRLSTGNLLLVAAAAALLAYFFWTRRDAGTPVPPPATTAIPAVANEPVSAAASAAGAVRNEGGILLDADGNRVLNAAGLPGTEPLPPAKPVPIKADPNAVVGYATGADGVTREIRAKDIRGAANTPGTYAVVDMWADGGPAVVEPSRGTRLTEAQVAQRRAEERAREAQARQPSP